MWTDGTMWESAVRGLAAPASALIDPSKRVFVGYLLTALAMGLGLGLVRGAGLVATLRGLFSPRVWWHPSARVDLRLMALKGLLGATSLGAYGVSMLAVAGLTAGALRMHIGAPSGPLLPPGLAAAVFTVAVFVGEDFTRYALHRAMHRWALLWEFHKVHHSAEALTPFTLYRTHPVESALLAARGAFTVGALTGLSVWAFGPSLRAWEVAGVDALGFAWTLLGANLRHSHVWLSYGRRVEGWLLSPAQHQIHHSANPAHFNSNYGTTLAVWDRLAGSLYRTTARPEALRFGLGPDDALTGRGALAHLLLPFLAASRRVATTVMTMTSRLRGQRVMAAGLVVMAALAAGCTNPTPVNRTEVVRSFARCSVATYQEVVTAATALATATEAHASAPTDATRTAAQAAWRGAIDAWQMAEMHRYGPTADLTVLGGQNLRERIYGWPNVNRCIIERNLVTEGYAGAGLATLAVSARGLGALEYLLFSTATDNACDPTDPINAMGTWAALSADTLRARRAAYARALAADVLERTRAVVTAWEPNGFAQQLTTAGTGSTTFDTLQLAISAVAEGVFYLDTDTKDLRLARPLGLRECTTPTCPEHLESPWAERGKQHLRNNLLGAQRLLEGCAAGNNLGFDDLLDGAGAGTLATRLRTLLREALAAVDAIPGDSLQVALRDNPMAVRRAHTAIQALTTFLKMEMSATLQIRSQRVEGDND